MLVDKYLQELYKKDPIQEGIIDKAKCKFFMSGMKELHSELKHEIFRSKDICGDKTIKNKSMTKNCWDDHKQNVIDIKNRMKKYKLR